MNNYKTYDPFQLLALIREEDQQAFQEMYERYFAQLYLQALRRLRGDRETAQDIVQDLFTYIWEKRKNLEINAGVSSYLYTAVRNRVIDYLARQDTRRDHSSELQLLLDARPAGTDRLIREKQLTEIIEKEIEQLSPQVRRVFELSRKENLSHAQISKTLSLSEHTVRDYVKSALRVLRVKLRDLPFLSLI